MNPAGWRESRTSTLLAAKSHYEWVSESMSGSERGCLIGETGKWWNEVMGGAARSNQGFNQ